MNTCTHCGRPLDKKPDKRSKTGNVFCNSSCAAKHNNLTPKRKAQHHCKRCGKVIWGGSDSGFCGKCYRKRTYIKYKTIAEVAGHRTDANKYTLIRQDARKDYFGSGGERRCLRCGYQRHIQICHIKGVAKFPVETLIKEVNSLDNLVAFCPTHHWEFDHGYIQIIGGKAYDVENGPVAQ